MSCDSIDIEKQTEQIKNNEVEDDKKIKKFYHYLEIFLKQDKYNLFKLKKNSQIGSKIDLTNSRIQTLIDLKVKLKTEIDNLTALHNSSKKTNSSYSQKLLSKLGLKK